MLDAEREVWDDSPVITATVGWHLTPQEVVIAGQGEHPWKPAWLGLPSEPVSLEDTTPLVVVDPVAEELLEALRETLDGLREATALSAAASERTARVLEDAEKTISGLNRAANSGYGLLGTIALVFGGRAAKRRWFNGKPPTPEQPQGA